ncbi:MULTISPECIES: response regulator transcription factor [Saccharibacillus]|uniref:response regulator transcription factor n=1 Tax=Saccharibacillus TaxID=456492 RepID=UPI001238E16E|nr:response regulator [Saccharibacillus sp. WB 17]MWJ33929.1 response regulator [Saccharibacillus sp. WB 17]
MKILIVDDEIMVHRQLEQVIQWERYGWEIVGHAYSGSEACRLIEEQRPDVVVTDIRMPGMDGLELLKWMQDSSFKAKMIVLSGYGDYGYSRSAFLLQAVDYLLKPVNEAELLSLLGRVENDIIQESRDQSEVRRQRATLHQGLQLMQDEWVSFLLESQDRDENEIIVESEQLQISLPEQPFRIVVVKLIDLGSSMTNRYEGDTSAVHFASRNVIQENLAVYCGGIDVFRNLNGVNEFVLFFPEDRAQGYSLEYIGSHIQKTLALCMRMEIKIGISSCKTRIGAARSAHMEALRAIEELKLSETDNVAFYLAKKPDSAGNERDEWGEVHVLLRFFLDTGAQQSGMHFMAKLERELSRERLNRTSSRKIHAELEQMLYKFEASVREEQASMRLAEIKRGVQKMDIEQIKSGFRQITDDYAAGMSAQNRSKSGKHLIEAIKVYAVEHHDTVTLDQISRQFFLNKNYFCTLFKESTGENFTEFLKSVRIEQAKKLLSGTNLKTYEVALKVGYADARYFSQLFKKATGIQPSHYKEATRIEATGQADEKVE